MVTNKEVVTKEGNPGRDSIACESHVHDESNWTSIYKGRKHRITPSPPPKSLLSPSLFVRSWVCEREKQCCPAEPEHHSDGGGERVLEKRRAEWHSGPCGLFLPTVCGKTLWGTQTRHSFTHRHYVTPAAQRRCRRREEGGVKQTEQKNFSDWGGIMMEGGRCKGDVGSLATGQTIQMRLPFLKPKHNGTNPYCQGRAGGEANTSHSVRLCICDSLYLHRPL